ncbi:hypothetical protein BDZ97DRAFT_1789449 [Flammula alnicola]|nr:hypothetical protein BDZ97DRAFT_1789449 [Flammula alnicola]
MSDGTSSLTHPSHVNSLVFPQEEPYEVERNTSMPRRVSRSSVMRLENILNDVSISHQLQPRSRSLGRSPLQTPLDVLESSSLPASVIGRSQSPDESTLRKKKVKMHKCPECQKYFPRPSGLRTHMNMHTKEKPFSCSYPGCTRAFSVVSNAKRHMRTHGVGVTSDDGENASALYVVGFEVPVVVSPPDAADATNRREPVRLRWIPSVAEGRRASTATCSHTESGLDLSKIRVLGRFSLDSDTGKGKIVGEG